MVYGEVEGCGNKWHWFTSLHVCLKRPKKMMNLKICRSTFILGRHYLPIIVPDMITFSLYVLYQSVSNITVRKEG